jgi:hypothetical protein
VVTITNIHKNVKITLFVLDNIKFIPIMESWVQKTPHVDEATKTIYRRNIMSNYEKQILATEQFYDEAILAAEAENIEVLSSVVPGSNLHEVINNPIDSGIDEG